LVFVFVETAREPAVRSGCAERLAVYHGEYVPDVRYAVRYAGERGSGNTGVWMIAGKKNKSPFRQPQGQPTVINNVWIISLYKIRRNLLVIVQEGIEANQTSSLSPIATTISRRGMVDALAERFDNVTDVVGYNWLIDFHWLLNNDAVEKYGQESKIDDQRPDNVTVISTPLTYRIYLLMLSISRPVPFPRRQTTTERWYAKVWIERSTQLRREKPDWKVVTHCQDVGWPLS